MCFARGIICNLFPTLDKLKIDDKKAVKIENAKLNYTTTKNDKVLLGKWRREGRGRREGGKEGEGGRKGKEERRGRRGGGGRRGVKNKNKSIKVQER